MTTVILTMIGILLAGAVALMTIFYGGGSFFTGNAKAQADTLLNAGNNVRNAAKVFYMTKGALPSAPATLTSTAALQTLPQIGEAGIAGSDWRDFSTTGDTVSRKAYVINGVKDDVCRYVNKSAMASGSDQIQAAPTGLVGCFKESGANVFYAMINDAASGQTVQQVTASLPGTGDTPADIASQISWVQQIIVKAVASLPQTNDDTDVSGVGNPIGGSWGAGVVSSLLYKPLGGKLSNYRGQPYMTIYLNRDPFTPFCEAWQNTTKPANVSNCDNYYFNHIVVYLG